MKKWCAVPMGKEPEYLIMQIKEGCETEEFRLSFVIPEN
jgi:hypothetical protein